LLAGHILAVVVSREGQGEGLAFASLHATHGVFEFLQHLTVSDQELEVFGLAAGKGFAVDLAFKVNRHAVAVLGSLILGALSEGAALLAQDFQGLVDGGFVHIGRQLLNFSGRQVADLDFGEHFEHGVKGQLALRRAFFFGDTGLASHTQLGFVGGHGKSLAHLVVHHFVLNGVAIALGHHGHRHLARTEAVHLDGAGQALQARVHFSLDCRDGQGQRDLAFELLEGLNGNSHCFLLIWHVRPRDVHVLAWRK